MKPLLKIESESDEQLMSRVQAEDNTVAFAELYDRLCGRAFRVAWAVCHDLGQTEDAVQDGFLSIWRGRAGYSPHAGASFRGWAMETVRNRAIDSTRREAALKRPPIASADRPELPDLGDASPLEEIIALSESKALRDLLMQLPDAQAEVISLAYFGELTHSEIASQLDLPAGTIKGRMRLGIEKLRREMDRDD